ncbi:membrane protein [Mesorhizobium sp. L-8-10]|uniref:tripartite tricarboxylate transporter TctB family protein n=1 Tax=unclassified Mesorhizobium TaxID=325217 RepID=UPI001926C665|nr:MULTISPECIES: tripartite tricarboxylate transporter TctB family protein [unclassified Mesorhizobium]BCH21085.1 membrane protein [Mesorhizobium sp. L-8-3]BCH28928.1 membrane protein [Mesorhizobium sp. L-8-10]
MRVFDRSMTDIVAGGATSLVGLLTVYFAWEYPLGTARDMGPGYFPTIAGVVLALLGLGIVVVEGRTPVEEDHDYIHPRQLLLVLGSIAAFAALVGPFGLGPATFVAVFLASLADRSPSLLLAAMLAVLVTAFSLAAFVYGLGVQIPAIRW